MPEFGPPSCSLWPRDGVDDGEVVDHVHRQGGGVGPQTNIRIVFYDVDNLANGRITAPGQLVNQISSTNRVEVT